MLFYTIFASLPILVRIFYYNYKFSTLVFIIIERRINIYINYLCIVIVFLVKIPIFLIHLWLPKAHVEAPISGSIILAGVILKLGGYGFMRILIIYREINIFVRYIFIRISLIGGLVVSLICICQSDIKSLVAYSSVAHIGLVLAGILSLKY